MIVDALLDEDFQAVEVTAGDSISVALDKDGQLRAWGSFRVRLLIATSITYKVLTG